MPTIFITGGSGCVGHYLTDAFSPDYELYLLVRNPAKLKFDPAARKNVHVVQGDLDDISAQAEILSQVDYCIHAATAWGAQGTVRINTQRTHELFDLLNPDRVKRIIYFSTASILGKDNQPLPEAGTLGTDYIRSKYQSYMSLPGLKLYDRITTVFPTLVFGGDVNHPVSFLSASLPKIRHYAWLLGRFNVETPFQFIHAQDIAAMVRHFIEAPEVEKNYVLGNAPLTLGQFTKRAAAYFGHPVRWQFTFSPQRAYRLAKRLGAEMSAWDEFCVEYNSFAYRAVNCPALGLPTTHDTVEGIMADWKLIEQAEKRW